MKSERIPKMSIFPILAATSSDINTLNT
jgi:hypothetical protein